MRPPATPLPVSSPERTRTPVFFSSRRRHTRYWRDWSSDVCSSDLGVVVSPVLLAIMAFGGLLIVTPSAGNAPALVRAQDQAHHVAYPGPPVPARFAAALVATEDKDRKSVV